jgi:hypothetical protein
MIACASFADDIEALGPYNLTAIYVLDSSSTGMVCISFLLLPPFGASDALSLPYTRRQNAKHSFPNSNQQWQFEKYHAIYLFDEK